MLCLWHRFFERPVRSIVSARQRNLETIHQHDVVAERHGLLGDLARELRGEEQPARHIAMRDWLEGA